MQRVCPAPAPLAWPPRGLALIGAPLVVRVDPVSLQRMCAQMALCPPHPFAPPSLHTLLVLLVQEGLAIGAPPTPFATFPAQLHLALLFQALEAALVMPTCALLESTM